MELADTMETVLVRNSKKKILKEPILSILPFSKSLKTVGEIMSFPDTISSTMVPKNYLLLLTAK